MIKYMSVAVGLLITFTSNTQNVPPTVIEKSDISKITDQATKIATTIKTFADVIARVLQQLPTIKRDFGNEIAKNNIVVKQLSEQINLAKTSTDPKVQFAALSKAFNLIDQLFATLPALLSSLTKPISEFNAPMGTTINNATAQIAKVLSSYAKQLDGIIKDLGEKYSKAIETPTKTDTKPPLPTPPTTTEQKRTTERK